LTKARIYAWGWALSEWGCRSTRFFKIAPIAKTPKQMPPTHKAPPRNFSMRRTLTGPNPANRNATARQIGNWGP